MPRPEPPHPKPGSHKSDRQTSDRQKSSPPNSGHPKSTRPRRDQAPPNRVVLRDLLIFQLKLGLDGIKDMILSPLAIGATILDILAGPPARGPRLYAVLRLGERFDLWLNLYGAAEAARTSPEGLYGGSRAGSDSLLGRLEEWSRGGPEPEESEGAGRPDRPASPPRKPPHGTPFDRGT